MSDNVDKNITRLLKPPDIVRRLKEIKNNTDDKHLEAAIELVFFYKDADSIFVNPPDNHSILDILKVLLIYEYDYLSKFIIEKSGVDLTEDDGDLIDICKNRTISEYLFHLGAHYNAYQPEVTINTFNTYSGI